MADLNVQDMASYLREILGIFGRIIEVASARSWPEN